MKQNRIKLLVILASIAICGSLISCEHSETLSVENIIKIAQTLERKELYKKALEELDGKTMYSLGNSSRTKTAISHFLNYLKGNYINRKTGNYEPNAEIQAEFPYYNPDFSGNISYVQPVNNMIFTYISNDIRSSSHQLSMTLIQDGNQIQSKMIDTGYLLNYIPKEWAGDKISNGEPLALQSLNKVFIYNNQGTKKFTNVWDFVDEDSNTKFMSPDSEPVGKNFLYMLTNGKYVQILKNAYLHYTGNKDDIDKALASVAKYTNDFGFSDDTKYSLAWIKLFIKRCQIEIDDGPIAAELTKKSSVDEAGLLVYSKLRATEETEETSNKNVTVAAYQDNYIGFGGYMYKHYLQILKTSPFPWTSCALINFMVTTQYGFSPWGKDMGGYCSNPSSNQDHSNDGGDEYPAKNDKGYEWWIANEQGKGKLVIEDPIYAAKISFIMSKWIDEL